MSNSFIDVHTFDGYLKNKYKPIKNFSIEEKENMFNNLKTSLKSPLSVHIINIMIKDLHITKGCNYQIENDMDSSDILADIIIYKHFKDIITILDEQLEDIVSLGSCPSGRTTRLFQIWKSIYMINQNKND